MGNCLSTNTTTNPNLPTPPANEPESDQTVTTTVTTSPDVLEVELETSKVTESNVPQRERANSFELIDVDSLEVISVNAFKKVDDGKVLINNETGTIFIKYPSNEFAAEVSYEGPMPNEPEPKGLITKAYCKDANGNIYKTFTFNAYLSLIHI